MQRFRISSQINYYFWFRWGSLSRLSGQVRFYKSTKNIPDSPPPSTPECIDLKLF